MSGQPGLAQTVPIEDRLAAAFETWAEARGVTGALGVGVYRDGAWAVTGDDQTRYEVASLSKAVTALCARALVEAGDLGWDSTVADLLGTGPDVTVAHLVTHSSGLTRDSTQAAMLLWLDQAEGPEAHRAQAILDSVAARGAGQGQLGRYAYNNENYALLAAVIEAATGQGYYEACWARLGLSAQIGPSGRTAAFGPWGGLEATPAAYLDIMHRFFGPGAPAAADPFAMPNVPMGGGVHYGMGMVFRPINDSHNFWHFGAHCFPGRLDRGSFAVLWEGKVSAVAFYDGCVEWDDMVALDSALAGAVYRRGP